MANAAVVAASATREIFVTTPPNSSPATREDLFAYLASLGIESTTVEHPAVFTVDESTALHRELPGGHTKNLFLKDAKDKIWLIVAKAHTAVDLKAIYKPLGAARFSFGKPELLMELLGVTPGSVTALSLINDHAGRVSVVVDEELMKYDSVNCHPLANTATTNLKRDDLLKFIRATGHEPRIARLTVTAA